MPLVYQGIRCPSSQEVSWHETNGADGVISLSCDARYLHGFLCSLRHYQKKTDVSWWALKKVSAREVVGEAWAVVQWLHNTTPTQRLR